MPGPQWVNGVKVFEMATTVARFCITDIYPCSFGIDTEGDLYVLPTRKMGVAWDG